MIRIATYYATIAIIFQFFLLEPELTASTVCSYIHMWYVDSCYRSLFKTIGTYLSILYREQVLDAGHYDALLRQGLDFFEAARFNAVPERWWRGGGGGTACSSSVPSQCTAGDNGSNSQETSNLSQGADGVLQCYRCQGFWHVAANCRHLPRCVRCGEPHSVEFCPRPRNNPICCHCAGPHHAGRSLFRFLYLGSLHLAYLFVDRWDFFYRFHYMHFSWQTLRNRIITELFDLLFPVYLVICRAFDWSRIIKHYLPCVYNLGIR